MFERKDDPFPDSVLVKRMEFNRIFVTEKKTLAVTIQRDPRGQKFLVRPRDGNLDLWLHLRDHNVTWE